MPTYDTPNSQHSYTVPDEAIYLDITIRGGSGGNGGDGENGAPGGSGGAGGEVSASYDVSGGETLTINIGEDGGDGADNDSSVSSIPVGKGGHSPIGNGGDGAYGQYEFNATGGGGGAASSIVRDSDGAILGVAEGGGGGGGTAEWGSAAGGGGGGGSRGGLGGGSPTGQDGQDAEGSGDGGDGGDGANTQATDGQSGGTTTHSSLDNVSTGTSTAGPVVEITLAYPPAAPTDLQATDVRATEIDITWTDPDGEPNTSPEDGYRVYTSRDGGSTWTEVADLAADTESYTITGLLHGEQYDIRVEAYNAYGTASTQ